MLTVLVFCGNWCKWNGGWNRGRGEWGERWQKSVVLDGVGEDFWGELKGGAVDGVYEVG